MCRTPKAWRCAGGARHVRAEPGGGGRSRCWARRDGTSRSPRRCWRSPRWSSPLVADHGILVRIQRVDDAWLRLMVSGRSAPVTVIAKFFNLLGLVYVTLPVRIAIAGFLALRRRWWHMAAFVAAVVLSEVLIGTLKSLRPDQAARIAGGHQRGVVPFWARHRRLGHRGRRGHRAGASRPAPGGVGRGRGGFLGPDGGLPRLPGRPLAVRRRRRDPPRDVVRAAGRGGGDGLQRRRSADRPGPAHPPVSDAARRADRR